MNCKLCSKETDYLEIHHIVPRSKGGLDNESNLIRICIDCHGLAHNVDFKRKSGLISVSIQKSKNKLIEDQEWCDRNEDKINKKIEDLMDEDLEKLEFVNYAMINSKHFNATNIKEYVLNGKTTFKIDIQTTKKLYNKTWSVSWTDCPTQEI